MIDELLIKLCHSYLALARILTIVENELPLTAEVLARLQVNNRIPVIGITGPPGAGKSTLVNVILKDLTNDGKKVAVLAVDPTSPFNSGALLGDRIRMPGHFNNPNVFIRSVASRGSVGGLNARIIEMIEVLKASCFDYIIVETVGVGQSEIEIAGLADITLVVLIPQAGDEIQHIKSGLMEIGDAFIVNKSDLPTADIFVNQLEHMLHQRSKITPVFKTIASTGTGIAELVKWLSSTDIVIKDTKLLIYTDRAFKIIQQQRMRDISKTDLKNYISTNLNQPTFNLYYIIENFLKSG
jgi:LAO/AO transport system kinase